jgi:hypothetical protein
MLLLVAFISSEVKYSLTEEPIAVNKITDDYIFNVLLYKYIGKTNNSIAISFLTLRLEELSFNLIRGLLDKYFHLILDVFPS